MIPSFNNQFTGLAVSTSENSDQSSILRRSAAIRNSEEFKVIETDPENDSRWAAYVTAHPCGSIYHHPGWLRALEREYGHKGIYYICEDLAGSVAGIMPLVYTRGLPFNLGGGLAGCRLSSLPRTPVAGPISRNQLANAALLGEAVQRVSRAPGTQLQIKTMGNGLEGLTDGLVSTPWRLSYVLRFGTALDGAYRVPDSNHRDNIKWAVRKASRHGVRVRAADTIEDLSSWYVLYLGTMRRNFVPARPYRFFVALWELLRPCGMMKLLLAEKQRATGARIIAGAIFLHFARTVSLAFSASNAKDLSLCPNDLILWEAINEACKQGYQVFDFGEVPESRPDLAKFKKKWGSQPERLYRYYYPATPPREPPTIEAVGALPRVLRAVWSRLPLRLTAYISDRIYSYL